MKDGIQGVSQQEFRAADKLSKPESLPHLSETVSWPSKETYFAFRQLFMQEIKPLVVKKLRDTEQFRYRDNPEITKEAATIYTRAMCAQAFLEDVFPTKTVPVELFSNARSASGDMHPHKVAVTMPSFQGGDPDTPLSKTTPDDISKLQPALAEALAEYA
jgi:hypothetical protein